MSRSFIKMKACPRCKGDILVDRAFEEDSELCLQCGFRGGSVSALLAEFMERKGKKREYTLKEADKLILKSP